MKYKTQILTKIDALETKLDYLVRNIGNSSVSGKEAIDLLNQQIRQLQSIRELIEAE